MSFLQRISDDTNPFAQVYNDNANWTYGSYAYEFTGNGYIFGFMTSVSNSLGELRFVSSSAPRYRSGFYCSTGVQTWDASDDEAIGYGNNVQGYQGTFYPSTWGSYAPSSRLNIIRMEG
jgi:hypothetical protein